MLNTVKIFLIFVNVLNFLLISVNSSDVVDLNGEWVLKEANGKYKDLKATVPGGIYTDLMTNKIIGDIFYGYNDVDTKWIPRLNWTYNRNFTVDSSFLENENINVVFEGLDTFAEIFLNEVKIGESTNMFVQYIFSIKDHIKVGSNELAVQFRSPIEVAASIAEEQPYDIPLNCPPKAYRGECHVNMIRKMQSSFSWDWGPSFPSVGIWKNVFIESYQTSKIRYVAIDTIESGDSWSVNIDTYLATNKKGQVDGNLKVEIDLDFVKLTKYFTISLKANEYNEVVSSNEFIFPKSYVHLWWPNGYGSQNLYNVTVEFSSSEGAETDTKQKRIGFKTVELVQDNVFDFKKGLTFYFKINNVSIFMKGSNEVPINILPERGQDKIAIKKLLDTAKRCHMNMLRVWGGGVYESEYFYELTNELGIVIWQDFMFACSLYPSNDQYLSNVIEEVRHQVKRLRSFANIIVFSGNNENEGALANNWYNTQGNFSMYKKDYVKLYIDTIKREFDRLTHGRGIFISSSPTNGLETQQEGWVAKNPGDNLYGDIHYYNYVLDSWNPNIYPTPRFASEYGYQSLPGVRTLLEATKNISDLSINGTFLDHRQHHPMGNAEMLLLITYQLKLPDTTSKGFDKDFIFYSQIIQAMAIKIETEHYRKMRNSLNRVNYEGQTMGALYWQLNDVWVAPTWSGIDYAGRWKMLQYFAQNFFAPVIIFGHLDPQRILSINVASDLQTPFKNAEALIQIYSWYSFEPIGNMTVDLDMDAGHTDEILSLTLDGFLSLQSCNSTNCFIFLSLTLDGIKIAPDNFVLPTALKNANITSPTIKIDSVRKINTTDNIYEIKISSDKIALFVWLESDIEGRFSDNGFLQNTPVLKVRFYPDSDTNADAVLKSLSVTNLLDKEFEI